MIHMGQEWERPGELELFWLVPTASNGFFSTQCSDAISVNPMQDFCRVWRAPVGNVRNAKNLIQRKYKLKGPCFHIDGC